MDMRAMLDQIFPAGALYMANSSPAPSFGGEWSEMYPNLWRRTA